MNILKKSLFLFMVSICSFNISNIYCSGASNNNNPAKLLARVVLDAQNQNPRVSALEKRVTELEKAKQAKPASIAKNFLILSTAVLSGFVAYELFVQTSGSAEEKSFCKKAVESGWDSLFAKINSESLKNYFTNPSSELLNGSRRILGGAFGVLAMVTGVTGLKNLVR